MTEDRTEGPDWAKQLTSRLDQLVNRVSDVSMRPALGLVRGALIASVGVIVGGAVLVTVLIALIKLFDKDVFNGRVWATDFLFGGILVGGGAFLFRSGVRRKGSVDE